MTWLIDRDGWYRIMDDGFEYLGPDRPDDLTNIAKVETVNGQRRIYQNSGGHLAPPAEVLDQVIPNATWTWMEWRS